MPLDAGASFNQMFVARRETGAAETFAVFAEGRAGDDGDFFRLQQTDREIFFVHAGLADVRKRIERATR